MLAPVGAAAGALASGMDAAALAAAAASAASAAAASAAASAASAAATSAGDGSGGRGRRRTTVPPSADGAAAGASEGAAAPRRRRGAGAGFSTRARFSRSQRARTRATCSSVSGLKWVRTGTSIVRRRPMTSSADMPNSPAMSCTRSLLTPPPDELTRSSRPPTHGCLLPAAGPRYRRPPQRLVQPLPRARWHSVRRPSECAELPATVTLCRGCDAMRRAPQPRRLIDCAVPRRALAALRQRRRGSALPAPPAEVVGVQLLCPRPHPRPARSGTPARLTSLRRQSVRGRKCPRPSTPLHRWPPRWPPRSSPPLSTRQ